MSDVVTKQPLWELVRETDYLTVSVVASGSPTFRKLVCLVVCAPKATADPSTHHPQTEKRLGPLSLRMTASFGVPRPGLALQPGMKAVEDVTAEGMVNRQTRVIEVIRRVVDHAELLHHASRAQVCRDRE